MTTLNRIHINAEHSIKIIHRSFPFFLLFLLSMVMIPHIVLPYAIGLAFVLSVAVSIPALNWFIQSREFEESLDIMSSVFLSISQENYTHIREIKHQLKLNIMLVVMMLGSLSIIYLIRAV